MAEGFERLVREVDRVPAVDEHTIGDGRDLQVGTDGLSDAAEEATLVEVGEEVGEISVHS